MINAENEATFINILEAIKKGTTEVNTIRAERGIDHKGKDSILSGEWELGGYTFKYTIPEGKKYGKATVEVPGSSTVVDTVGLDKLIDSIVYGLRHPKQKSKKETK